jgi:hypothetical protein
VAAALAPAIIARIVEEVVEIVMVICPVALAPAKFPMGFGILLSDETTEFPDAVIPQDQGEESAAGSFAGIPVKLSRYAISHGGRVRIKSNGYQVLVFYRD